jgi:hypothetical protein
VQLPYTFKQSFREAQMDERENQNREDLREFARLLLLTLVGMLIVGGIVFGTAWYINQTWATPEVSLMEVL